jgi:hypothetical protein
MVVRATGANGKGESVEALQQQISESNQRQAANPANIEDQFRDQSKRRYSNQQTAAERDQHPGMSALSKQRDTCARGCDSHQRRENRPTEQ